MQKNPNEILIAFAAVTAVIVLLVSFIIIFSILYQRRQHQFRQERQALRQTFNRELLLSQLETQNQTLQHIAEELHDHIGQLLTVAILRLDALEDEVTEPNANQSIQQTQELVRTIIDDVRALAKTLDHSSVQRFGLLPVIRFELERIQRFGQVYTQLEVHGEPYSLSEQTETVLLRMMQEAVNNSLKHAHARNLTVSVYYQPETFLLSVADNGRGFDIDETTVRPFEQSGAGLGNLYRRAGLLGGTCIIDSQPNGGTRVEVKLPRNLTFE